MAVMFYELYASIAMSSVIRAHVAMFRIGITMSRSMRLDTGIGYGQGYTFYETICHRVKLLTCPMLLAKRRLMFHRRTNQSSNGIVQCIRKSVIGCNGTGAKAGLAKRRRFNLLGIDFSVLTPFHSQNIFMLNIERIRNERMMRRDAIDP